VRRRRLVADNCRFAALVPGKVPNLASRVPGPCQHDMVGVRCKPRFCVFGAGNPGRTYLKGGSPGPERPFRGRIRSEFAVPGTDPRRDLERLLPAGFVHADQDFAPGKVLPARVENLFHPGGEIAALQPGNAAMPPFPRLGIVFSSVCRAVSAAVKSTIFSSASRSASNRRDRLGRPLGGSPPDPATGCASPAPSSLRGLRFFCSFRSGRPPDLLQDAALAQVPDGVHVDADVLRDLPALERRPSGVALSAVSKTCVGSCRSLEDLPQARGSSSARSPSSSVTSLFRAPAIS